MTVWHVKYVTICMILQQAARHDVGEDVTGEQHGKGSTGRYDTT
jgi:hypothetical protein